MTGIQTDSTVAENREKRWRILLIDDNAIALKATQMMLELSGYEVHVASSGQSALKAASDFQPDLVLSDISLPDMSGYELLQQLKKKVSLAKTLFIALSGYGDEEADRARQAGFDDYIVKPMELEAFDRLIVEMRKTSRTDCQTG